MLVLFCFRVFNCCVVAFWVFVFVGDLVVVWVLRCVVADGFDCSKILCLLLCVLRVCSRWVFILLGDRFDVVIV